MKVRATITRESRSQPENREYDFSALFPAQIGALLRDVLLDPDVLRLDLEAER